MPFCLKKEDAVLWQEFVKTVQKIKQGPFPDVREKLPEIKIEKDDKPILFAVRAQDKRYLEVGDTKSLDKRLGERLKQGKIKIEARLDLHGDTLEEAFFNVRDFIFSSYNRRLREVLIVTGIGHIKIDDIGRAEQRGILRSELPKWLNNTDVRPLILSFTKAKIKDGGEGAFYVYLKKHE